MDKKERKVGLLLGIFIFFMPYIFGWFLLRDGHTTKARVLGLGWMVFIISAIGLVWVAFISMLIFGDKNTAPYQNNTTITSTETKPVETTSAATKEQIPLVATDSNSLWSYSTDEDKMRKITTNFAALKSSNELFFDFPYNGGSTGTILLRKKGRSGNDVMLIISKGQFFCTVNCGITAKFDDGKIEKFAAVGASDGSTDTIFIQNYDRFTNKLKKSKNLIIEAEFFQAGRHQIEFNVSGLNWQ